VNIISAFVRYWILSVCLPLDTLRSSNISAFSLFCPSKQTNTTIIRRLHGGNHSRPVPKSDNGKCGGEGVEGAVSAKGKGPTECKFLFKIFSILCLLNTNMVF